VTQVEAVKRVKSSARRFFLESLCIASSIFFATSIFAEEGNPGGLRDWFGSGEFVAEETYVGSGDVERNSKKSVRDFDEHDSVLSLIFTPRIKPGVLRLGAEWERFSFGIPDGAPLPDVLQAVNLVIGLDTQLSDSILIRLEAQPGVYNTGFDNLSDDFNAPFVAGGTYIFNPNLQLVLGVSVDIERKYPVVVRLREDQRRDTSSIGKILVETPRGLRVPLDDVATLSIGSGSMNIAHESGKRLNAIGVFLRGRDMGSAVEEMQQRVKQNVPLPQGYYLQWGGEFENQQRAMGRLRIIVPLSIFLIFLLLFNAFGSVKSALLILSNIPFALVGGILALLITKIPLSVSAAIGFIALFGQAVLNGVVIVSYFNALRGEGLDARQAAIEGSLVRFRTVLMTALLAMLGLLPMALSKGIGSEVQKPLAVVIIGGLVSATALTLVVLPALYTLLERRSTPKADTPVLVNQSGD